MPTRQPCRYWFTGGIATVLAAASQWRSTDTRGRALRRSPLPLEETAARLEREARQRGLPVYARLTPPPAAAGPCCPAMLLVLGTDVAQTPVLQTALGDRLELPLAVRLEQRGSQATELQFSDSDWLAAQPGLPPALVAQVATLPTLVTEALAASAPSH